MVISGVSARDTVCGWNVIPHNMQPHSKMHTRAVVAARRGVLSFVSVAMEIVCALARGICRGSGVLFARRFRA